MCGLCKVAGIVAAEESWKRAVEAESTNWGCVCRSSPRAFSFDYGTLSFSESSLNREPNFEPSWRAARVLQVFGIRCKGGGVGVVFRLSVRLILYLVLCPTASLNLALVIHLLTYVCILSCNGVLNFYNLNTLFPVTYP